MLEQQKSKTVKKSTQKVSARGDYMTNNPKTRDFSPLKLSSKKQAAA